jgi:hypothetical protein
VRARSFALLAVAALAACGGSGEQKIAVSALPMLVLQPSDLPRVFVRFDDGRLGPRDMSPPRSDPARFGRVDGWKARYRRPGSQATRGPLVVQSTVDLFDSARGAKNDLAAFRGQFDDAIAAGGGKLAVAPTIGAASHVLIQRQPGAARPVLFFTIAWRVRNVTASVLVQGFEGKIELGDALALARRQERRIADVRA